MSIRLLSTTRYDHDSQLCEQQQHRSVPVVHMWRQRERMAGLSAHLEFVQQQHMSAWVKCHEVTACNRIYLQGCTSIASNNKIIIQIGSFLHEIFAASWQYTQWRFKLKIINFNHDNNVYVTHKYTTILIKNERFLFMI